MLTWLGHVDLLLAGQSSGLIFRHAYEIILTLFVLILIASAGWSSWRITMWPTAPTSPTQKLAPSRLHSAASAAIKRIWFRLLASAFQSLNGRMPENIAFWSLRPFRHVTLVTK
jgi:hypothetical protein